MKRLVLSVGACAVGDLLCGQALTDTVRLRAFEVVAPRAAVAGAGMKTLVVDSTTLERYSTGDLGQLLTNETPVFVKSYGLGSLATTSFRGGSASQTAVLWIGFNIGSPMNGQLDLSLLPALVANDVAVQFGSSTALWGSGAIGGAILLNNLPLFDDGLRVKAGLSFGSFGDRRQQVRVQQSAKNWVLGIGAYNSTADNDFPLPVTAKDGSAQLRQTNASFTQRGLLGDAHVRLGQRHRIGLHAWYQDTDRRIPPTIGESTARQQDESLRLSADWQRTGTRNTTCARIAWFDESLEWFSSTEADVALGHSRVLVAEVEDRFRINERHQVHVGLNSTYARALADGYPDEPEQGRNALFGAYRYTSTNDRFVADLSARQEVLDGDLVPFTASMGGEYSVRRWLVLKAQGSKVYRIPTFNDRYWRPGGNPDLRSEHGYSADLGAVLDGRWKGIALRSELTWFNRLIDDWIQWMPGPSYWSPRNILQVWSRGVETYSTIDFTVRTVGVKLGVMTNHVVSTNQVPTSTNDASVDKQLIYVPMYGGHGKLGLSHRGVSLTGIVSYTGYRYTSTDNRQYLEPYWISNAWLAYRLPAFKRCTLSVQAQCNNLFDEVYQVMLNRPMPLRNYQLGIHLEFHRPPSTAP